MPMARTPFEHAGEVAVATKWTGERAEVVVGLETVALAGSVTYTPANAGRTVNANTDKARHSVENLIPTSPA